MFAATVREEVCRLSRPGTRWLSTGHDGGESRSDAAYILSVPEGWDDTDVTAYVNRRRRAAGFPVPDASASDTDAIASDPGAVGSPPDASPALLTGVSMRHARRARLGDVEAVVTAGVSNPAALPVPDERGTDRPPTARSSDADERPRTGTVNVVVGTARSLAPGALANLVAVAAEAKAATLLARTGFPGTTSDAVLVGCDPAGEAAAFSGSATAVGSAARACVRDALLAALDSRYGGGDTVPATVEDAEYGVVTDERARVSRVADGEPDR
ncbi:adenosylcobinamide amidohydrolase [Halobellus sp. GM3]|uniref:adenosylcobinamide amidohydrolase n=1 Tax=Halobellus sp. GM3 TaxID=3458410 RepID=UPI00403E1CCE